MRWNARSSYDRSMPASPIDEHLAVFEPDQRQALVAACGVIRTALPGAQEAISYGVPTFKIDGVAVIGLDGFTRHNSLFTYSSQIALTFASELARFEKTKGSIHFGVVTPFPAPLLKRIIRSRITEINAGYPKKGGEFKEFYDNGHLKAQGRMKDGRLHADWRWWRRDGSLLRSGSFKAGEQVGEWTTFGRDGSLIKVTTIRE